LDSHCSLDGKDLDEIAAEAWKSSWTGVTAIRPTANPSMITVQFRVSIVTEQKRWGSFELATRAAKDSKVLRHLSSVELLSAPRPNEGHCMGSAGLTQGVSYQSDSTSPLSVSGDMLFPTETLRKTFPWYNAQCTMHNAQCTMHNARLTRSQPLKGPGISYRALLPARPHNIRTPKNAETILRLDCFAFRLVFV
jgi:hypothetical protein